MADKGYDVEVRMKGKDQLSSEIRKPKNAVDELSHAADPKAKGAFSSFSRGAVSSILSLKPALDLIKSGLHAIQSVAMTAFRTIVTGAKWVVLALSGILTLLIKFGSDVTESENLFVVSMGNMVDAAQAWAEETAKALRQNENDIKKYLGTFNVMLVSMGAAPDKAFEMSKAFTKLTYDLASFYNLGLDEAFEKLQAGITGEVEPLKRLGIVINETAVQAYALAHGIGAATGELTEGEKILARYGLIMERTAAAQGDWERTLGSASNRFKQIWLALKQFLQEVGKGITDSKIFNRVIGFIGDTFNKLKDSAKAADITATIDRWTTSAERFFKKTLRIEERFKALKAEALALLRSIPFGEREVRKTGVGMPAWDQNKSLRENFEARGKDLGKNQTIKVPITLGDINFSDIAKKMQEMLRGDVGGAITWIEEKVRNMFRYIASGDASKDWQALKTDVADFGAALDGIYTALKPIVKGIWEFTTAHPKLALMIVALVALGPALLVLTTPLGLVAAAIALIAFRWEDVKEGLSVGAQFISENFRRMGQDVERLWFEMKEGFKVGIEFIKQWFRGLFLEIVEWWRKSVQTWKDNLSGLISFISDWWSKSIQTWKDNFSAFFTWLKAVFSSTIDWLVEKGKDLMSWLNPFARHSPSMVDNWRLGLLAMRLEYAGLNDFIRANPIRIDLPRDGYPRQPAPPRFGPPVSPWTPQQGQGGGAGDTYHQIFQLPPQAARPGDAQRYALAVRFEQQRAERSGV